MSERMIPGRGPLEAEICVVGEAPGSREMLLGQPFVGPSGRLQDEWVRGAGLNPAALRYENVYPTMPPGGSIEAVPWEELQQWSEDILARLDDMPRVRVIVATGNVALGALLGMPYYQANITQRRGSVYIWEQASGRRVKVIPVIHPAAVLREEGERGEEDGQKTKKSYEFRCRCDWEKVAREVQTGIEGVPPERELIVQPFLARWEALVQEILLDGGRLAFDIETNPVVGKILCISFASCADWAVSVPWSKGYKEGIRALLESPLEKTTQNGQYDCFWLRREGFEIVNWKHDTMAKSCLLWPNEPHSLAYLASICTNEPWYKGGDEDTGEKHWKVDSTQPDRWRALLEYNARDSAVTWEVDAYEDRVLLARGWMEVYEREYQALLYPVLEAMLHGIRAEKGELSGAFSEATLRARLSLDQATRAAGRELFTFDTQVQEACWRVALMEWDPGDPVVAKKLKRAKGDEQKYVNQVEEKGISNKILAEVLYDEMRIPAQRDRMTKRVTTSEAALLRVRQRYKDKGTYPAGMELIEGVLKYREQKKQSEFLDPERLDDDGRFRTSYSFRPTTGRLSSSKNPKNSGGNVQNIDRDLRGPFKPDEGCVLTEVDLSQAEGRDVYCLTRDRQLIEMAHSRPSVFDMHSFMASEVLGFGPWGSDERGKKQKKDDRYLSKRVVHATHYDLHGNKGSEICLKDEYDISPKRFEALQRKYKEFAPGIDDWQQRTRMEGFSTRRLTNSWGRTIEFPWERAGDAFYRRLYAWRPQSDIARHLNRAWVIFREWIRQQGLVDKVKINLQLHDALYFSSPLEWTYDATAELVRIIEEPHDYYGEMLRMPAEVKVGLAWGQGVEFKELPEREEFEWKVREMMEAA